MFNLDATNYLLKEMSKKLNRNGFDYCVHFVIFPALKCAGSTAESIVHVALGRDVCLDATFHVSIKDALSEIEHGFNYAGDGHSHPSKDYAGSDSHKNDVKMIMERIVDWLRSSGQITGLTLGSGHPLYPVFWGYEYLIESEEDAYIFIGSCSD